MNEQAIPVLITFLAVAGIAALLLRRALTLSSLQRNAKEAQPAQAKVTHPNSEPTNSPIDRHGAAIRPTGSALE
ncbi:MAG: hypothetical protein KJ803_09595 [Gammaproteobacteria bacterium]|nr:hypothetical protein [Gammaproteobacteria bacterium]